jgi:hypothetical protein
VSEPPRTNLSDAKFRSRIQMELDSRKNEAKADLKQQDIAIEVPFVTSSLSGYALTPCSAGITEQVHCGHQ